LQSAVPSDPQDKVWDIIVIGTGAGGGTAGFNLARNGCSVLFLERGSLWDKATVAQLTERDPFHFSKVDVVDCSGGQGPTTAEPLELVTGIGLGGSTALYAMMLDRFRPVDFAPQGAQSTPEDCSLPAAWPIQYESLEPYYREAEALFRVRGTDDPLATTNSVLIDPLVPSEAEAQIESTFARCGLHPYRLHYAREFEPGCDGCVIRRCPKGCRQDVSNTCVVPAIKQYGAHILPNCLVLKLVADKRQVREAVCEWRGRKVRIRGKLFVLALNALFTPALLLRSVSNAFPDGLANGSGMVGRNLMLHVSDRLRVKFKQNLRRALNGLLHNGLSLNDFYVHAGQKLGNIHAHAIDLSSNYGTVGDETHAGTLLCATILEDFPYYQNRVIPKRGDYKNVSCHYTYKNELRNRGQLLVSAFAESISDKCEVSWPNRIGALNVSHMCGTCRFGNDPNLSVLDKDNKMHELDNAYVVDTSFFPSSGGINPGLTVIANSLRVTDRLLGYKVPYSDRASK
jgi:choline dehydrogenase-like flavoprotein